MLSSDRLDKQFSQHSDPNKKDAAVEHQTSRPSKIEELTRRLAETEAALQAVVAGQIDAVIDPEQDTPLLLREAQAQLRRNKIQ